MGLTAVFGMGTGVNLIGYGHQPILRAERLDPPEQWLVNMS